MQLIRSLNQLPIDCAVPVGIEVFSFTNVRDFSLKASVETQIRDQKVLKTMAQRSTPMHNLIEDMMDKLVDAFMSLLPALNSFVSNVVQTLAYPTKCVEIYIFNYRLRQYANTYAIAGYYDRVKIELHFNDDAKIAE
ncbi:hypothetical protein GN244_ATG02251 [Phytophthora infestans]|uniref:Uncharacterized protein n=1 Tax=Phytophthora infestans TaxID=4787 RepID=A0A833TRI3_PHYIN|nr:hypothetical protein GN244_ATG02251 [Phytophthora infestans]KAF4132252.1 hypothetical protein GN958_ATG18558 [Phytophthora infestans]